MWRMHDLSMVEDRVWVDSNAFVICEGTLV